MFSGSRAVWVASGVLALAALFVSGCPQQNPPSADFSGTPLSGQAPLQVQFTDGSGAGSGTITQWHWEFGDSGISTKPSPAHTYHEPGTYSVSLRVQSEYGQDTELKTGYVTVSEATEGEGEGEEGEGEGEDEAAVIVDAVTATAGAQASVPVVLDAQGGQIATLMFQINYSPEKIEFIEAQPGAAATAAGKLVRVNETADGTLRVAVYGDVQTLANGPVAVLRFGLAGAQSGEQVPIACSDASAADPNAAREIISAEDGAIQVH